jgi:hypothetical protein
VPITRRITPTHHRPVVKRKSPIPATISEPRITWGTIRSVEIKTDRRVEHEEHPAIASYPRVRTIRAIPMIATTAAMMIHCSLVSETVEELVEGLVVELVLPPEVVVTTGVVLVLLPEEDEVRAGGETEPEPPLLPP